MSRGPGGPRAIELHFGRLAANAEAYGLVDHRHTPEIEQELEAQVIFTPHLLPVSRGMLVTAYGRLSDGSATFTTHDALTVLRQVLRARPLRRGDGRSARGSKDPVGSNLCFVSARGRSAHRVGGHDEFARQPDRGRGGAGDPGLERRDPPRRDARTGARGGHPVSGVVVKLGGHALDNLDVDSLELVDLAQDVADLRAAGTHVVIVHGGGPQIAALLDALGIASTFHEGLRVTDDATMDGVVMALGRVNLLISAALNQAGLVSVGLSGVDAALFERRPSARPGAGRARCPRSTTRSSRPCGPRG